LRKDLPALVAAISARHPGLAVATTPALGESPEVLEAVAAWLRDLA
jgi:sirohydrochlorin cobaltochelatase